jgi:hypothetical protein
MASPSLQRLAPANPAELSSAYHKIPTSITLVIMANDPELYKILKIAICLV